MPRVSIYNGEYNDNRDYCLGCCPDESEALQLFQEDANGDPENVTVGDDHPDYRGEEYRCEKCNEPLTGRDN